MNDVICFIYFNMIIIIIKQWRKIIVLNDGQLLSIAVMKQCLIAIRQFQLTIINWLEGLEWVKGHHNANP